MKKIIISLIFLGSSSLGMNTQERHIIRKISPQYSLEALNFFISQREIALSIPPENEFDLLYFPITSERHCCLSECKLTAEQIKKDIELLHQAIKNKNNKEIKQFALERTFIFFFKNNDNKTAFDLCTGNQEIAPLLKELLEKNDFAKHYRLKETV